MRCRRRAPFARVDNQIKKTSKMKVQPGICMKTKVRQKKTSLQIRLFCVFWPDWQPQFQGSVRSASGPFGFRQKLGWMRRLCEITRTQKWKKWNWRRNQFGNIIAKVSVSRTKMTQFAPNRVLSYLVEHIDRSTHLGGLTDMSGGNFRTISPLKRLRANTLPVPRVGITLPDNKRCW